MRYILAGCGIISVVMAMVFAINSQYDHASYWMAQAAVLAILAK